MFDMEDTALSPAVEDAFGYNEELILEAMVNVVRQDLQNVCIHKDVKWLVGNTKNGLECYLRAQLGFILDPDSWSRFVLACHSGRHLHPCNGETRTVPICEYTMPPTKTTGMQVNDAKKHHVVACGRPWFATRIKRQVQWTGQVQDWMTVLLQHKPCPNARSQPDGESHDEQVLGGSGSVDDKSCEGDSSTSQSGSFCNRMKGTPSLSDKNGSGDDSSGPDHLLQGHPSQQSSHHPMVDISILHELMEPPPDISTSDSESKSTTHSTSVLGVDDKTNDSHAASAISTDEEEVNLNDSTLQDLEERAISKVKSESVGWPRLHTRLYRQFLAAMSRNVNHTPCWLRQEDRHTRYGLSTPHHQTALPVSFDFFDKGKGFLYHGCCVELAAYTIIRGVRQRVGFFPEMGEYGPGVYLQTSMEEATRMALADTRRHLSDTAAILVYPLDVINRLSGQHYDIYIRQNKDKSTPCDWIMGRKRESTLQCKNGIQHRMQIKMISHASQLAMHQDLCAVLLLRGPTAT